MCRNNSACCSPFAFLYSSCAAGESWGEWICHFLQPLLSIAPGVIPNPLGHSQVVYFLVEVGEKHQELSQENYTQIMPGWGLCWALRCPIPSRAPGVCSSHVAAVSATSLWVGGWKSPASASVCQVTSSALAIIALVSTSLSLLVSIAWRKKKQPNNCNKHVEACFS